MIVDYNIYNKFMNYLPELKSGNRYYMQLLFRRKYIEEEYKSQYPAEEKITSTLSKKETLGYDLQQWSVPDFSYYAIKGGKHILLPNEAITAYIYPNQVNLKKLYKNGLIGQLKAELEYDKLTHPMKYVDSEAKKSTDSNSDKIVRFDFDKIKLDEVITQITPFINLDATSAIITKGGVHILVKCKKVNKEYQKNWYNNLYKLNITDEKAKGIPLSPVPGTLQNNHIVNFITHDQY